MKSKVYYQVLLTNSINFINMFSNITMPQVVLDLGQVMSTNEQAVVILETVFIQLLGEFEWLYRVFPNV